ncbi:hypothetical protein EDB86DRAFT_2837725 [Lactarius hatsudake]|nr:hypothetical protein EDB86DRAFT_2837725 [Lactarius hatsudake]
MNQPYPAPFLPPSSRRMVRLATRHRRWRDVLQPTLAVPRNHLARRRPTWHTHTLRNTRPPTAAEARAAAPHPLRPLPSPLPPRLLARRSMVRLDHHALPDEREHPCTSTTPTGTSTWRTTQHRELKCRQIRSRGNENRDNDQRPKQRTSNSITPPLPLFAQVLVSKLSGKAELNDDEGKDDGLDGLVTGRPVMSSTEEVSSTGN